MSKLWQRYALVVLVAVWLAGLGCAQVQVGLAPERALGSYVSAPDPSFAWERGTVMRRDWGTVQELIVTSQTWRGIKWQHLVRIYRPAEVKYPGWAVLFVTGGSGTPQDMMKRQTGEQYAAALAQGTQMPVVVLLNVPNQPLFGGMTEDEIISYTFAQFMKDGDPTWPLLFPMAKSAVKTMDAVQAFAKADWKEDIRSFMVFGGSKRGWTTWLTGAVEGGGRVKAIAPMVIDNLNLMVQMPHQLELWGAYSEEIGDYSAKGLQAMLATPRGKALAAAVDPYTFRGTPQLRIPKLLVNGSNDPYWATDALNFYWDDLQAPKYVLYAPNSGHGLDDTTRVTNTLTAFFRTIASGRSMPQMSWKREAAGDKATITITAPAAKGARAWFVVADNLDFRPQRWESIPMTAANGGFRATMTRPADKNMAMYGEADFEVDGRPFTLSTQNVIVRK